LGILVVRADSREINSSEGMTTKGAMELSEGNNVLVFVLDRYESSWFEEGISQNKYLQNTLSDFTYYKNSTSQFFHTIDAIPNLLTGIEWSEEVGEDYLEYAYNNSDAIQKIYDAGYDVGIYTDEGYLSKGIKELTVNYDAEIDNTFKFIETLKTMSTTSMYKIAPFACKQWYIYYSKDINELASLDGVWNVDDDLPFYNMLINEGVRINNDVDNTFRFYHMYGAHSPCSLSVDLKYDPLAKEVSAVEQGMASLKIVSEYLEQMKELGLYESATIIITADHGQSTLLKSDKDSGQPDAVSCPLFLVKFPNDESETMTVSNAPISQQELIPTIMSCMGLDGTGYGSGKSISEIEEDEIRERFCVNLWYGDIVQYTINGDAGDINSWNIKKAIYNN
jgi:hypothetical protein